MKRAAGIVLTVVLAMAGIGPTGGIASAQTDGAGGSDGFDEFVLDGVLRPLPVDQLTDTPLYLGPPFRSMSDDGNVLMLLGGQDTFFIWNRATRQSIGLPSWSGLGSRLLADGSAVMLFPVVGPNEYSIRRFDVATGQLSVVEASFDMLTVGYGSLFSDDGSTMVIGAAAGAPKVVRNGRVVETEVDQFASALSGDGRYLFWGSGAAGEGDGDGEFDNGGAPESFFVRLDLDSGDTRSFPGEVPILVSDDGTAWVQPVNDPSSGRIDFEFRNDSGFVRSTLADVTDLGTYFNARFADRSHDVVFPTTIPSGEANDDGRATLVLWDPYADTLTELAGPGLDNGPLAFDLSEDGRYLLAFAGYPESFYEELDELYEGVEEGDPEPDIVYPEGNYGTILYDLWQQRPVELAPAAFDGPILSDQIDRLSLVLNQRRATPAEMAAWRLQRAQGMSLAALADSLLPDAEAVSWTSCCNGEFVEDLYFSAFGRGLDDGAQGWIDQLDAGVSPGAVTASISESVEHVERSATTAPVPPRSSSMYRLYRAFFARAPDPSGLDYWRLEDARGVGFDTIATSFAASPEFANQVGQLSDTEFVTFCYEHVLGRTPDDAGAAYWLALMGGGLSRGGVMAWFSESAEFILTTDTLPE